MHQFVINDWKLAIKERERERELRRKFSRLLIFHNDSFRVRFFRIFFEAPTSSFGIPLLSLWVAGGKWLF